MSIESNAFQQRFDAVDRRSISPFSSDLTESSTTQIVQQARSQSEISWLPSMNVDIQNEARPRLELPQPAWARTNSDQNHAANHATTDATNAHHATTDTTRTTDATQQTVARDQSSNRSRLADLPPPAWNRDSSRLAARGSERSNTSDATRIHQDAAESNTANDLVNTRESLLREVDERYNTPELNARHDRFRNDMATFEQRARERGLSSQEISNTYHQISRILNASDTGGSNLPADQRLAVASQVMHNAATPSDIRQNQNTCNVTSLETRLYSRNPAAAARLVADVATTGSFTGTDGTTVTLDPESMQPSQVGTDNFEQESERRSLASQLFQVTAANIANRQDTSRGTFQYFQRQPANKESGEQLLDLSTNPPQVIGDEPGMAGHINGLIGVEQSITGDTNAGSFLYGGNMGRRSSRGFQINSADALGERLQTLNESGQLPAVVFVHADAAMFNPRNDRQPDDLNGDGHFVTVTGYDPATRTVRYDDQYGREDDHNDTGIPLEQFYNSTHIVTANERLDRLEARYSAPAGQHAPAGTLERVEATDEAAARENELEQDLSSIGSTFTERWRSLDERHYADFETPADRQRAVDRIIALAQTLPEDRRQAVIASLMPAPAKE